MVGGTTNDAATDLGAADLAALGSARQAFETVSRPPRQLTPSELIGAVVACDRLESHLHAVQAGLVAEFSRPGRCGDLTNLITVLTEEFGEATHRDGTINMGKLEMLIQDRALKLAAAELGVALRISPQAAAGRVQRAVELVEQLPGTCQALLDGQIDKGRARSIAEHTSILDDDTRALVEHDVLPLARRLTPGKFGNAVARAVIIADPDAADKRAKKAHRERRVTRRPLPDGVGLISAFLPADAALSLYTLLDLIAAANRGIDDRCVDERRADALTDIAERLLAGQTITIRDLLDLIVTPDTDTAPADEPDQDENPAPDEQPDPDENPAPDEQPGPQQDFAPSEPDNQPYADTPDGDGDGDGAEPDDDDAEADGDVQVEVEVEVEVEHSTETDASTDAEAGQDVEVQVSTETDADHTDLEAGAGAGAGAAVEIWTGADGSAVEVSAPKVEETEITTPPAPASTVVVPVSVQVPAALCRPANGQGAARTGAGRVPVPTRQGRPIHLNLTLSMATFCGLDQLPGHLAGHGAMTADWARTFSKAAQTVTLLILDPATGETIGITDRTYRPRQALRDQVTTLNDTCIWLGCGHPSYHCDLDHIDPYNHHDPAAGGATTTINIDPGCKTHHLLKTHGGWTYRRNPDRSLTFTSPTGHMYNNPAEALTLPGEWLRNDHPTPRTHIGLADQEHAANWPTPEPEPDTEMRTLGDHIRAYLQTEKRRLAKASAADNKGTGNPAAGSSAAKDGAAGRNDDPPPF